MVFWSHSRNVRLRFRIADNDRQLRMWYNCTGDITLDPVLRLRPNWSRHRRRGRASTRTVTLNSSIWRGWGHRWPSQARPRLHSQRWSKMGSLECQWSTSDRVRAVGQKPITFDFDISGVVTMLSASETNSTSGEGERRREWGYGFNDACINGGSDVLSWR